MVFCFNFSRLWNEFKTVKYFLIIINSKNENGNMSHQSNQSNWVRSNPPTRLGHRPKLLAYSSLNISHSSIAMLMASASPRRAALLRPYWSPPLVKFDTMFSTLSIGLCRSGVPLWRVLAHTHRNPGFWVVSYVTPLNLTLV
jgi:hypothetical protein